MTPKANRPRVLVVVSTTKRRGAETEGMNTADGLRTRGFPVELAALHPGDHSEQLPITTLGPTPLSPATLRALRAAAKRADIVIAYGSSTLPACAIALLGTRIPFVYRSIGDPGQWVRGRAHQERTGLLMRRARHVAAIWPAAADSIHRLYRVPSTRLSVIPNARDAEYFQPPDPAQRRAAREQFDVRQDGNCIALVGALADEKQLDLALRAVAPVPEAVVLVAGDGPNRAALETLAHALLPGRVRFLGTVADVRPILHAADAIVLTSRTEGLPGALIEAGLCGVPAVAVDVGGVGEIVIDGRTGRLLPTPDVEAITQAIVDVLARRAELGAEARIVCAQRFDTASTLDHWEHLLTTIAGD